MFFEDRASHLPASGFSCSDRTLEGGWIWGWRIAGAAPRSNSYYFSVTQTYFFLSLLFQSFTGILSPRRRSKDYGGISRTAAVRAILTVKMPEEPIIIIVPGSWI
jgi:hypothetical protein